MQRVKPVRINYINKCITTTEDPVVVHGVNNQGTWGSGVAVPFFKKWPDAANAYLQHHKDGKGKLGGTSKCLILREPPEKSQLVVNAITQEFFGSDGKKYASYDAVDEAMCRVKATVIWAADKTWLINEHNEIHISLPKIGCGRGGLDWNVVRAILVSVFSKHSLDCTFVLNVYEIPDSYTK